jgi:hypothetical protein
VFERTAAFVHRVVKAKTGRAAVVDMQAHSRKG